MKLYHGTNVDFERIELSRCKPNKDFGKGFYLTDVRHQAQQMAIRKCTFEETGSPLIQVYEVDDACLSDGSLNVKMFESVNREWAEFILMNRKSRGKKMHEYDIVVGPVADDGVVYQLNLYLQRIISLDTLVEALTYRKLNSRYCFLTEKAINKLKRV